MLVLGIPKPGYHIVLRIKGKVIACIKHFTDEQGHKRIGLEYPPEVRISRERIVE